MSDAWYYGINKQNQGPVSKAQLGELLRRGEITRQYLVIREGMPDWEEIGNVPELRDILPAAPPQTTPAGSGVWQLKAKKNGVVVAHQIKQYGDYVKKGTNLLEIFDGINYYMMKSEVDGYVTKVSTGDVNTHEFIAGEVIMEVTIGKKKGLFG